MSTTRVTVSNCEWTSPGTRRVRHSLLVVNDNPFVAVERRGGYLWAPKTKRDGSRDETYENLTRTARGDIVFSYASGTVGAVGVVSGPWREQRQPMEFGQAGQVWNPDGWMVPMTWVNLAAPLVPAAHMEDIAPLLPPKYSPLQRNGRGNQGCYLAAISEDLGKLVLELVTVANPRAMVELVSVVRRLLAHPDR